MIQIEKKRKKQKVIEREDKERRKHFPPLYFVFIDTILLKETRTEILATTF